MVKISENSVEQIHTYVERESERERERERERLPFTVCMLCFYVPQELLANSSVQTKK